MEAEVDLVVGSKVTGYEEGWRNRAYFDSLGYPTIGFGFLLGPKGTPLDAYKFFTMPKEAGEKMLECLLRDSSAQARIKFSTAWQAMNSDRRVILLSMIHQLGLNGVLGFPSFLKAAANSDWREAYNQMLDSKWARQDSKERAMRHALVMYHGSITQVYGEFK